MPTAAPLAPPPSRCARQPAGLATRCLVLEAWLGGLARLRTRPDSCRAHAPRPACTHHSPLPSACCALQAQVSANPDGSVNYFGLVDVLCRAY